MKKWFMAVLFGTLLVLGACGGSDDNNDNNADNGATEDDGGTVDMAAGEDVYKKSCASCHGDDLSGAVGPSLEKVGADHSVDDIKNIIENGQGSMPAGLVSGDDEQAVAEWLATHK
jgi:cytochrome c551